MWSELLITGLSIFPSELETRIGDFALFEHHWHLNFQIADNTGVS
jgi:hypothetical protein